MKHSSFEAPAKHLLPSFVFPRSVFAHTTLLISLSSSRSRSVPHLCLLFIAFALKNFVYLLFLQSTPPPRPVSVTDKPARPGYCSTMFTVTSTFPLWGKKAIIACQGLV